MKELIARRMFTPLYIWLDIAFLIIFAGLLLYKKKYMTVLLRCLSSRLRLAHNLRRAQSFSRAFMDVYELRFYEFHLDMALDFKGQAPF